MVSLCTNSPLPTFDSLYQSFASHLTFPPQGFVLPELPTLPSPMFPTMKMPNLEAVKTIVEMQSMQLLNTAMAMIQPLVDFLGGDLASMLPKIPVLNLNLIDLLTGVPGDLIAMVREKMSMVLPVFEWPFIPKPFYSALAIPDMSSIQGAANLIKSYLQTLVGFIFDLIGQVTSLLKIGMMPALPSFPTMAEVKQMVMAKVDGATSMFDALMSGISLPDLFDFDIPGFPKLPSLPSPLVPSINIPEFDFAEAFGVMMNHMTTYCMSLIMDFIDSVLGLFISFSFPTFCLPMIPDTPLSS